MPRRVALWTGATPDSAIPPRVRLRVWDRCEGKCHRCGRKIPVGDAWIIEHLIAIINGGLNAESNLCLSCSWCKPLKDAEDVAEKAKTYAVRSKHLGIRKKSQWATRPLGNGNHQHTATRAIRKGDLQ